MSAADKPDLGSLLKSRREECGLSVQELATRTRIRRTYLQALEANCFDIFPGETYLIGFLRVYAQSLGLQPASLLAMYEEQVAGSAAPGEIPPAPPDPPPAFRRQRKRGGFLPWLAIGLLTAAALVLVTLKPAVSEKPAPAAPDLISTVVKPAEAAPAQEIHANLPAVATAAATAGVASSMTRSATAETAAAKDGIDEGGSTCGNSPDSQLQPAGKRVAGSGRQPRLALQRQTTNR